MNKSKKESRKRVRYSIRKKISGTADVPRLAIFRSNKQIYAQIIDDVNGNTLASASSMAKLGYKVRSSWSCWENYS